MDLVHHWTQLHVDFVSMLLKKLEENRVCYFVLRNYEKLPYQNTGKDIDIVIEPSKYNDTKDIILQTMKNLDIHYYQITQFDRMRCWYIMDDNKHFGIHIDIIENEVYKGFEFYDFEVLYANTEIYNGFYILNKTMDTMLLLIQNLVAYKSLKQKYIDTIRNNYTINSNEIDKEISFFWGEKVGSQMIDYLKNNDFDSIVGYSSTLANSAMKRIFMRKPLKTFSNIVRFLGGKFYRIVWCPQKYWRFFAVEAPDGTGKTTFIDNLVLKLRKYYVSDEGRFCIHHFRPSILPNLGAAGESVGIMKQDKDFTNPHRAKQTGFLSSLIRMIYYWLDYVIGIPIIIRKEVQYEKYTIFDRYIYDFLVDPKRSRIALPLFVRKLFTRLVIQPQIVFVLQADADVIYKRKQELTKGEITRQLSEFKKLESLGNKAVFINANRSVDAMVQEASSIIMKRFLNHI